MVGDVEKMIGVGLIWGATNSLMRRGAHISDATLDKFSPQVGPMGQARKWAHLILTWQYSLPFLLNLSASAAFFYILADSPISLAVPVTNATTFAATAASALLLGEDMLLGPALLGTALIILGVWICVA